MAECNEKEALALRAFRRTGRVVQEAPEGEALEGRGIISALRKETGEIGGVRHSLGILPRPLYRFTGWFPGLRGGMILRQAGERYQVLDVRKLLLGERELCTRALLERREKNDVNGAIGSSSGAV